MGNKSQNKKRTSSAEQDKRLSFIRKIPFFSSFDDHEVKQLLSLSRWLRVPTGTQIIKENTTDRILYILVKGSVSVFKTLAKGDTLELTTLNAGATFGEMAMVAETKRTAGVRTLEETYILMVEPEILHHANVFLQLKFYKRFCEIMVQRLAQTNRKLAGIEGEADSPQDNIPPSPPPKPKKPRPSPKPITPSTADLPAIPAPKSVARSRMQRRILGGRDLPVNPAVAAQLSSFLVGHDDDTRHFAELISLDPAMAAKVLQVANSSYYRRTTPVSSVAHALVTVGIKNIQEVVGEEAMKIMDSDDIFSGFQSLSRSFWQHSIVVGRIAELLKEVIRIDTHEDVYLAGLLHDIGKLALDEQEPSFYPQLLRPQFLHDPICEVEHHYIGADHCRAGGLIAEKFGLSKSFVEAINHHHRPEKAKENPALVALVTLADLFALQRGIRLGYGPEVDNDQISNSFAWILIRESQSNFMDVNIDDFIGELNQELERSWPNIIDNLP